MKFTDRMFDLCPDLAVAGYSPYDRFRNCLKVTKVGVSVALGGLVAEFVTGFEAGEWVALGGFAVAMAGVGGMGLERSELRVPNTAERSHMANS